MKELAVLATARLRSGSLSTKVESHAFGLPKLTTNVARDSGAFKGWSRAVSRCKGAPLCKLVDDRLSDNTAADESWRRRYRYPDLMGSCPTILVKSGGS